MKGSMGLLMLCVLLIIGLMVAMELGALDSNLFNGSSASAAQPMATRSYYPE